MILGLEMTLVVYGLLAAVFAWLRRHSDTGALRFMVVANLMVLYHINSLLFLYWVAQLGWVGLLYRFIAGGNTPRSLHWSWLAFIGLMPLNLVHWSASLSQAPFILSWQQVTLEGVSWRLGASFFVIRSFIVLREALAGRTPVLLPALACLSFLPAFSAGPVCGSQPWAPAQLAPKVQAADVLRSLMRFGWGAASLYVVAPALRRLAGALSAQPLGMAPEVGLNFAALYFDFAGYSAMALAMAALFGVRLPENFNRPYLATSVREFWRRWHMSLSDFVATYLFKPLVRRLGSRWLGLTAAFLFTGMWHELSLPYMAWGLAHGLAMSATLINWPILNAINTRCPRWLTGAVGWVTTMSFVAWVSYLVQGHGA